MVQAKRKSVKKPRFKNLQHARPAFAMLGVGVLLGALGAILWQGLRDDDAGGVGGGIRKMMDGNAESQTAEIQTAPAPSEPKPDTTFDFFTVLPAIEVETPEIFPGDEAASDAAPQTDAQTEAGANQSRSAYMLQAASYRSRDEAETLKAQLAFDGLLSGIQKVTVHGRGDFYRVRLGPFGDRNEMLAADKKLAAKGIRALRIKVSQ